MQKSGGLDSFPEGSFMGSNGAIVDQDGSVLLEQHGARRIVRLDDQFAATPVVEAFEGKKLNSPNDMTFHPDGSLWFTDPPYGLAGQDQDPAKEVAFNGVYRWADGKLTAPIRDLPRPNGIAFSPDGKVLYVSNSGPAMFVQRYDVGPGGRVSGGRRFAEFPQRGSSPPPDVPDGLKVDSAGNVWATGPGGIRIYHPDGRNIGQIRLPEVAANLTWGGPDLKTAYIMGSTSIYTLQTLVPGPKPLYPK
jgi:gluconolactonase